jgi:hypothetical protein
VFVVLLSGQERRRALVEPTEEANREDEEERAREPTDSAARKQRGGEGPKARHHGGGPGTGNPHLHRNQEQREAEGSCEQEDGRAHHRPERHLRQPRQRGRQAGHQVLRLEAREDDPDVEGAESEPDRRADAPSVKRSAPQMTSASP